MRGKVTSNFDSPVYYSLHGCIKQAPYFTGALPWDELKYFGNSNNIHKAEKFTSAIRIYKVTKKLYFLFSYERSRYLNNLKVIILIFLSIVHCVTCKILRAKRQFTTLTQWSKRVWGYGLPGKAGTSRDFAYWDRIN